MAAGRTRITPLSVAGYFFAFALCAKGVALYQGMHPDEESLLRVEGNVTKISLGGDGRSTRLDIDSGDESFSCSSYYGKVWPGMHLIVPGDRVEVLLERNRLNSGELVTGKRYYIWRLVHEEHVLVRYEDIAMLVTEKEAVLNWYINLWIAVAAIVLVIVYARRPLSLGKHQHGGSEE